MKSFAFPLLRVLSLFMLIYLLGCPTPNQPQDDDNNDDGGDKTTNPSIVVYQGTTQILPSSNFDFGSVIENDSTTVEFAIANEGDAVLELSNTPPVSVEDQTYFEVNTYPQASINVGDQGVLSISFSSATVGTFDTTVQIDSNDPNSPFLSFTISGECTVNPIPEIALTGPDGSLASGTGSFTFNDTTIGNTTNADFTIENIGSGDLELNGSPIVDISGTDADHFTVHTVPDSTITSGSNSICTIGFQPTTTGTKTAEVNIANNDDDENPYTFGISGYAESPVSPEIDVLQGGTSIPHESGNYQFDETFVGYSRDITFEISNTGDGDLILHNNPPIILSGDTTSFSVISQPATTIAPGDSANFPVDFAPTTAGSKSATAWIPNNDSDENIYELSISGEALLPPDINVLQGSTDIPDDTGEFTFEDTKIGESSLISFTIENLDAGILELTGTPYVTIDGTSAGLFNVTTQPASPINPAGNADDSTSFEVEFSPDSEGYKSATLRILSNDPDESEYDFAIVGTGTEWSGVQQVDSASSSVGSYSSLARDGSSNAVYISYHDDFNGNLKFARSDDGGATWPESYIRTVDSSGNVGLDSNIGIVGGGTLAIAYRDLTNDALKLALSSNQGDSWTTETLDGSGHVGSEISMDMYGYSVYISYYDSTNDDLKFIKYDTSDSSTVTATVDSTGNVGTFNCIAYDFDYQVVYIAYYDSTNGSIKLAKFVDEEGSSWSTGTVLTDINTGGGKVAISVPSGGEIHLAYRNVDSSSWKNLMYTVTTDNGTSFTTTTPVTIDDSSATIGMSFSRPRFDSSDTSYIAYSDNSNDEVQLAVSADNGSTWTTSVIDQVDQLSSFGISLHWINNMYSDTTLYVSYCNEAGSSDELMFAKSIDAGGTW